MSNKFAIALRRIALDKSMIDIRILKLVTSRLRLEPMCANTILTRRIALSQ